MKSQKLPLKADFSLAEGSQIVLKELFRRAIAAGTAIDEESDPEELHRFRVSLRSIRSYLSLMKGVFNKKRQKGLAAELGAPAKTTNRLRDLDVMLIKFEGYKAELNHLSAASLKELQKVLEQERTLEFHKTAAALEEMKALKLIEGYAGQLELSYFDGPRCERNLKSEVVKRIGSLLKRVSANRSIHQDKPEDGELHKLRISIKKLRYLLALFSPILNGESLLKKTKHWQDLLGDYVDLSVEQKLLHSLPSSLEAAQPLAAHLASRQQILALMIADEVGSFLDLLTTKEERERLVGAL